MKAVFITQFENHAAAAKREGEIDLDRLVDLIRSTSATAKAALPWLKLARFGPRLSPKGSLRHDANVLGLHGIELDYDLEIMSVDTAIETAEKAGLLCLVYTSPSHTPERPRWRILCPTSRELPPAERAHLVSRVNGLYRGIFATESWTLSQSYYFGAVGNNPDHQAQLIDGECVDLLDELDLIAIGKPNGSAGQHGAGASGGPLDEAELANEIVTGSGYHVACVRLIGKWAQQGVSLLKAQRRIEALFDKAFPPDRDQRWRDRRADVARCVLDIYGKESRKKDEQPDTARRRDNDDLGRQPREMQVHDAGDIEISKIPPRGWLLGVSFCRKFLSGLIAEGGVGKTALRYVQYLAAASGRNLTGEAVHHRCRVLIACFEDDLVEVRRRIGAAMLHHGVTPDDIKGWLFYACPRGLKVLQNDPGGARGLGPLYAELRHIIETLKIDIVSLDPFVKSHGVEENDNNAVDDVCTLLAQLTDEFDCDIDIVHHTRKGAATPGDVDRMRGASAAANAGRLMRTATSMTTDEAELFGVSPKDRAAMVRVDDAKVNITPRSTDAMWFQLVGVPLKNPSAEYPNGDNVQSVARWYPPDVFKKFGPVEINQILDLIEAGPYPGGRYSPAPNAKDRAAWPVVQQICPDFNPKQAKHVIAIWLKTGVLVKREHEDPKDRHNHPSLFIGRRPGDSWDE